MTNFSLSAMPESSKAKPRRYAHEIAIEMAKRAFNDHWSEGGKVHLQFSQMIDIIQRAIEETRNERS
jgi:hypothetical protein